MNTLALFMLALLLLAVVGGAIWNWRREAQLQQLAERAQQQGELIEAMNAVLDNPQLSEEEQLEQSQRLVEKLKATQR
ncbi:hypothetical protein [Aquipseudomonas guryensis]|jgi:uncharacterized coiled-coil protein SlyX|uniref:Uncharacterized protein n=1 Tax=Aquipseudomonas guryensis TaxID=2759165 RepID=A0A7W4H3Q0_9GAMM|nr:hypothetical protein [Pseudomonas guryensis]MBB1518532.1 hypothetical protein [Pseudomonas guryensis]